MSHDMKYDSMAGEHIADITISNRDHRRAALDFFGNPLVYKDLKIRNYELQFGSVEDAKTF